MRSRPRTPELKRSGPKGVGFILETELSSANYLNRARVQLRRQMSASSRRTCVMNAGHSHLRSVRKEDGINLGRVLVIHSAKIFYIFEFTRTALVRIMNEARKVRVFMRTTSFHIVERCCNSRAEVEHTMTYAADHSTLVYTYQWENREIYGVVKCVTYICEIAKHDLVRAQVS